MKVSYWEKKEVLNEIEWIKKYNAACDKYLDKTPDEISYLYSYFSIAEHQSFIREITNKIGLSLKGNGLEIGSGPGVLSISLINIFKNIKNIVLLDKVPNAHKLQEKLINYTKLNQKIDCAIGDFNDLKIKDNSLDFVLDFDAVHHSENFDLTFKEISRVLVPGGIFLCFDRGQPNTVSKKHIEYLLDIEYNTNYKLENNIPIDKKFTRRMNGETEPYLKDWLITAKKHKFSSKVFIFHKKSFKAFLRSLYGLTPFLFRKIFNKGYNITTHYQVILHYFKINNFKGIKVFNLNFSSMSPKSPKSKMIFLFKK